MTPTRNTVTLALLLLAAGSLAFATGATVVDGPADSFADDDLAVQPADGPNGKYAYLNDDDEIAIDVSASNPNIRDPSFEGVNVGTTGTIDDVFTITYTADEYAHVWIEHEGDAVTFVVDGESIEGEANNVTLAPDETVTVGLALDASDADAGTQLGADEFSIGAKLAEPEAATTTTSVSTAATGTTPQTTDGGPTTTVTSPSADRREFVASDVARGGSVRFPADGMHLAGDDVTLEGIDLTGVENERVELDAAGNADPFAEERALTAPTTPRSMAYLALEHDFVPDAVDAMTIRFSADPAHLNATGADPEDVTLYRQTDAGEWEAKPVEVVDEEAVRRLGLPEDRVHFRATTEEFSTFAVAERVPRFDVTEARVAPEAIDPGEAATVRATVRNGGGAAGERAVTLTAGGDPVANETVALEPNETATVELGGTFETAGRYELAVDGTPVGTLIVGDPAGDDGGGSAEAGGSDDEVASGPVEEPAALGFGEFGGLLAVIVAAVAGITLFRRIPRP